MTNQERELREVAEAKVWEVVDVYRDNGISGLDTHSGVNIQYPSLLAARRLSLRAGLAYCVTDADKRH